MELKEALLIVAVVVILIAMPILVEKYFSAKAKIMFNLLGVLILIAMFTSALVENFTYKRLALTLLFAVVGMYSFYRRYKKYKQNLPLK